MSELNFDNLDEALQQVVEHLIAKRHCYIINIRGPEEIAASHGATLQIVAENIVYQNGKVGLTIHLPFDPSSGEFQHLVEFVGTNLEDYCDEYYSNGIPCFAMRVGSDMLLAERVLRFILRNIYGYPNLADFEFEVYDEGPVHD